MYNQGDNRLGDKESLKLKLRFYIFLNRLENKEHAGNFAGKYIYIKIKPEFLE